MRNTTKRLFSTFLALAMMASLMVTAFASPGDVGGGGPGSLVDEPVYIDYGNTVTFKNGGTYDLTAKPGTSKNAEGDVLVGSVTGIIPEGRIPGVTAADAYYNITGWAVKDKDGNLEMIDLKTYRFNTNTKVYAVVEDVWPVYKDMKQDRSDWFYQYVRDLSIAGVVNGYPGYIFAPKGNVTWGEALKLVMLAAGYEEQAKTDTHWASGYLTKAKADKLISGTVDLDAPITRLAVAQIAAKAMELNTSDLSSVKPFTDTSDVYVQALSAAGIVEGYFSGGTSTFRPSNTLTRGQVSAIVWRMKNYNG